MEAIFILAAKSTGLIGIIAIAVEWAIFRHTKEMELRLSNRDKEIDQRNDRLELDIARLESTLKTELKYIEKAIDGMNGQASSQHNIPR